MNLKDIYLSSQSKQRPWKSTYVAWHITTGDAHYVSEGGSAFRLVALRNVKSRRRRALAALLAAMVLTVLLAHYGIAP